MEPLIILSFWLLSLFHLPLPQEKNQFWGSNSREKQMAMFKEERSIGGRTRNAYSLLNNTAEEKEWEAVQETSPLTNVREPKVM